MHLKAVNKQKIINFLLGDDFSVKGVNMCPLSSVRADTLGNKILPRKTSMMWPSQNSLLYNGTVIKIKVNEWINN